MFPEHAGQLRDHRMILGERLGFELLESAFHLCRVQFHARLLTSFLVGRGPRGRLRPHAAASCEGYERRQGCRILIARPHQHGALVRKFSSIRAHRELNTGQWCLIAPVQPGNEIKFVMFRRKAFSKSCGGRAEPYGTRQATTRPAISRREWDAALPIRRATDALPHRSARNEQ